MRKRILTILLTLTAVAMNVKAEEDVTAFVINPTFENSVEGWTVDMSGAQNKGYQGASYKNGEVAISQFAEAWIPKGSTLGGGKISQVVTGLPDGTYKLEADIIACNQSTGETVTGVSLFASSNGRTYETAVATADGKPQHYSLTFSLSGESAEIGLSTTSSTRANWVAMDNIKLTLLDGEIPKGDPSKLIINEIQVCNIDQFIDPSYNYGGWIEIYNPTSTRISLGNLCLSNDFTNLKMCQLPLNQGYVGPNDYAVIWFDHYDTGTKYSTNAFKQVNFKLTYEGGTIYLSDSDGNLITQQTYPQGIQRVSYARTTDGGNTWNTTSTPTPGSSNDGSKFAAIQLDAPVVNKDATLYTNAFNVKVTIPDGASLYYTTDGSTPTQENGQQSESGQFYVSGGTKIFRFRLFRDGFLPSPIVTRTYIYKDKDYYLPIISVVTDSKNLYDDEIGAYTIGTNGISGQGISYNSNKNRSWERPVNFEYLVPDENTDGGSFLMAFSQECDFEVCGGWSRNLYAPNASFRLKGGKYYLGQNFFPYQFFENKPYIKSKTLQIRNGGNDGYARIKDGSIHQILLRSGMHIDCQSIQPVHVFINGEYQFMFNIREPNNKNHGYSNYGIDTDYMDQFEVNSVEGYVQKTGTIDAFKNWMDLAKELGTDKSETTYNAICDLVDIDEYINYMAVECYVGSSDWILNSNNIKGYRSRDDGKFHLVFMDVDAAFAYTGILDSFSGQLYDSRYPLTGKNYLIDIFLNMMKYEPFRKRFVDAFCLVNGSVFEDQHTTDVVNELREKMTKAIGFEGNVNTLNNSANYVTSNIISNRSDRMSNFASHIRNNYGLGTIYNVTLSSNNSAATLSVNGQQVPTGKFKGELYAPVTLKAEPFAGYRFAGWSVPEVNATSIFGTDSSWLYYDQGSLDGKNWKSTNYSTSGWSSGNAPLGYGNVGINGSQDWKTQLDYGSNPSNKRPTYYFRKTFNVNSVPTGSEYYQLRCYVDDGCVVYVNGTEIGHYLMNSGTPSYSTYSSTYMAATAGVATFKIDNGLLQKGNNVIAVEVHNTSASSSDIYWTAELQYVSSNGSYVSTSETLDLSTLGTTTLTLTACYEKLPEDELMANLAVPVKVNEVSAYNDIYMNEYFKKNDWVELYNTTDTEIDAAGLYISDNIDDPLKYQIPKSSAVNTIIPAHGRLIVWADKLDPVTQLHASFKLSNDEGSMLLVSSSDEFVANNKAFFNAHSSLKDFADGLIYCTQRIDQTVGRYPDGGSQYYLMSRPTIEQPNSLLMCDELLGTDNGIMELVKSTFSLQLAEGWNWASHPMFDPLSVNLFSDKANRIIGQTTEAVFDGSSHSASGTLTDIDSHSLYKFQMSEAENYEIDGRLHYKVPKTTLVSGWNWISYPVTGTQTLQAALPASSVKVGDIIMGQSGFSTYTANGWVGTLSSLVPGNGYLYKSMDAKDIRFNNAGSQVRLRRSLAPKRNSFGLSYRDYPNVMGIIAQLQVDGQIADPESFTVVAHSGDKCRGVSQTVGERFFLSLYGNGGETLNLCAIGDDGSGYRISNTFSFASDVQGTMSDPLVLQATKLARGDVNADSSINFNDVTALVNIILSKAADTFGNADVNHDGKVTIADVTSLVNLILGKN